MEEKDNRVTAGEIVSSIRKYSNIDDASRIFNIHADVNIQNGEPGGLSNGSINRRATDAFGSANFSCGKNMTFFSFNSTSLSQTEIMEAIKAAMEFIANVEKDIKDNKE